MQIDGLDLLDELRLRRWAREHYIAAGQRDMSWHPVVLEEMLRRDAEATPGGGLDVASSQSAYRRRLDAIYGPRGIAPHFRAAAMEEPVASREMHYY